jgi:two-component system OmpR family sensor kinase
LAPGQTIRLFATSEPLMVDGDPVRLEQVLLNLLNNAHEHAPDTSAIDVTLRAVDDAVELEVRDYGPGIPPEEASQLFSSFYQVTRAQQAAGQGLGLGLYIAHEIVTGHGGTIGVESAPGPGSRFLVRLPRLTGEAGP